MVVDFLGASGGIGGRKVEMCCNVGDCGVRLPAVVRRSQCGQMKHSLPPRGEDLMRAVYRRVRAHDRREASRRDTFGHSFEVDPRASRGSVLLGTGTGRIALALAGKNVRITCGCLRTITSAGRGSDGIRGAALQPVLESRIGFSGQNSYSRAAHEACRAGKFNCDTRGEGSSRASRSDGLGQTARRKTRQAGRNRHEGQASPSPSTWSRR